MNDDITILADFDSALYEQVEPPLVSLYLPTHGSAPGDESDRIEFEALVEQARAKLAQERERREYKGVDERLAYAAEHFDDLMSPAPGGSLAVLAGNDRTYIYRLGYVQIFQQGLGRTAVRRNIGQAGTVMAEQHRAVLVQHQGQRQLLLTVGRRVIAAALGIPHDLPCFQAVGAQRSAAGGNIQQVIQNAVRIAQQRIRQGIRPHAADRKSVV